MSGTSSNPSPSLSFQSSGALVHNLNGQIRTVFPYDETYQADFFMAAQQGIYPPQTALQGPYALYVENVGVEYQLYEARMNPIVVRSPNGTQTLYLNDHVYTFGPYPSDTQIQYQRTQSGGLLLIVPRDSDLRSLLARYAVHPGLPREFSVGFVSYLMRTRTYEGTARINDPFARVLSQIQTISPPPLEAATALLHASALQATSEPQMDALLVQPDATSVFMLRLIKRFLDHKSLLKFSFDIPQTTYKHCTLQVSAAHNLTVLYDGSDGVSHHLSIHFHPHNGSITRIDEDSAQATPEKCVELLKDDTIWVSLLMHACKHVLICDDTIQSSLSGADIVIKIHPLALKLYPEAVAQRLSEQMNRNPAARFFVQFLSDSWTRQVAMDAGGLTKEFLDTLCRELVAGSPNRAISLSIDDNHLCVLSTKAAMPAGKATALPIVPEAEAQALQSLGALQLRCWNERPRFFSERQSPITGRIVRDSFFACIASMQSLEPLEGRDLQAKVLALGDIFAVPTDAYQPLLALANHPMKAEGIQQTSNDVLNKLYEALIPETSLWPKKSDGTPDVNYIRLKKHHKQRQQLFHRLRNMMFEYYAPIVASARAVAKGMDEYDSEAYADLCYAVQRDTAYVSTAIQGQAFDRAKIAAAIVATRARGGALNAAENTRIEWLRAWIRHPATTQEEVERLIQTVTGHKNLASSEQINILFYGEADYQPLNAHTCFSRLDLSAVQNPALLGMSEEDSFWADLKDLINAVSEGKAAHGAR